MCNNNDIFNRDFFSCLFCNLDINDIFINCIECNLNICLECFAQGREIGAHRNSHSYKVINFNQIETYDGWSLNEELEMLKELETNRNCVNQFDQQKLSHLSKWFDLITKRELNEPVISELHKISRNIVKTSMVMSKDLNEMDEMANSFNYRFMLSKMKNSVATPLLPPMRPAPISKQYRSMSGYRFARGDFETEYNDKFEIRYIADMDFDINNNNSENELDQYSNETEDAILDSKEMKEIECDLKISILNSYQDIINERYERKKLIRGFGLLNEISTVATSSSININEKSVLPLKLQRLFNEYDEYIKFIELSQYLLQLKKKLNDLNEYRAMGLRSLKFVPIYKNLRLKRLNRTHSFHLVSLITSLGANKSNAKSQCQEWFKQFVLVEKNTNLHIKTESNQCTNSIKNEPTDIKTSLSSSTASTNCVNLPNYLKYKNNPLKIENYPDFDKLNQEEKEFCRVARFQPTVFLRVRTVLLMENEKAGFCSYSRARKIAGIDVNKTRLIHNFLVNNELINSHVPNS